MLRFLPVLLVCTVWGYAWSIFEAQTVDIQANFYFLVLEDLNLEVGAEFIKLDGGAGYFLEYEGEEYVVVSVYREEQDGLTVQENLAKKGRATKLLSMGMPSLRFQGKDRKKSGVYVSALNTFNSYMGMLEECLYRLEGGMTQEDCRQLLAILERQYVHAQTVYADYPDFVCVCKDTVRSLRELQRGIIYAKDLRYLQCRQAEDYLQLCQDFRI